MSKNKIKSGEIRVIYLDLGDNFGFYNIRPGKEPYICLHTKLLEGGETVHQTVFRTLLEYHRAIPADSIYRCFPLTRYFKELAVIPAESELAGAGRRWTFPVYLSDPDRFRLIG